MADSTAFTITPEWARAFAREWILGRAFVIETVIFNGAGKVVSGNALYGAKDAFPLAAHAVAPTVS